jgi:aryl carrier-like protein
MYDVIGDVHGQGAKLRGLLARMGYVDRAGAWHAPQQRQAVFVGDLIDRGPQQLAVLDIVRRMVDAGQARVVMGNHEFNAIGLATVDPDSGKYLRPRSDKNLKQHAAFLREVGLDSTSQREWVEWFRRLPMALDLGGLRVVHAWWDAAAARSIEALRGGVDRRLDDDMLRACYRDSECEAARKLLTCGVEMPLPEGEWIIDKEGHRHPDVRLAVWRHSAKRLADVALVPAGNEQAVPDIALPAEYRIAPVEGAPILFGHHWFSGPLKVETSKVACLDWSAAKGGPLVAYRWDGEDELRDQALVAVGADAEAPCLATQS